MYGHSVVTIVYPVRTAASQAAKTGSNPVGDATFLGDAFAPGVTSGVNRSPLGGEGQNLRPFFLSDTNSNTEQDFVLLLHNVWGGTSW